MLMHYSGMAEVLSTDLSECVIKETLSSQLSGLASGKHS